MAQKRSKPHQTEPDMRVEPVNGTEASEAASDSDLTPVEEQEIPTTPGPKPVEDIDAESAAIDTVAERDTEMATLKDQVLRAMAEVENTRKRLTKERDDAARYGAASLARDMLNVADNLRRALDSIPEDALADETPFKALADGVKLIEEELLAAFTRHGVEKIEPWGEKFDHNFHQAMMELENTGKPPGTIAQVMAPGYVLNGRLLRPAMVGIAKGPAGEGDKKKVDTTA